MGRKPTKCKKKCPNHLISFKAINYSAYFSREVHVSFCPPTLNQHPLYPTFNRDSKYYTTSFILHCEQEKYDKNDVLYKAEHDRFCQQQLDGKSKMLQPKPRSKNQYCHVCKDHYDDYLQHISSRSHKESISKNRYTPHIQKLIDHYFPKKKEDEPLPSLFSNEELILQKELSLNTVSSSIGSVNGETINEPRFCDQFKQFGTKGVFGLYCDEHEEHRLDFKKELKELEKVNEDDAKILFTPSISERKNTVNVKTHQPIILNSLMIHQ